MAEILIPVVALAGAAVLSSMDKKKRFKYYQRKFCWANVPNASTSIIHR